MKCFLKLFKKHCWATSACQEMFCEVTERSNHGSNNVCKSKSQMFDQQCLIAWPGPYDLMGFVEKRNPSVLRAAASEDNYLIYLTSFCFRFRVVKPTGLQNSVLQETITVQMNRFRCFWDSSSKDSGTFCL